jgi:hypothetical protein
MGDENRTQLLERDASDSLTKLISTALMNSPDFEVLRTHYLSDHFGPNRHLLGVWEGDLLISTMRADVVYNPEFFEGGKRQVALSAKYPALYLCRGATAPERQFAGLNSLLRYYCIEAAQQVGVKSILGHVFKSAARTSLMRSLGYEMTETGETADSNLRHKTPAMFAILDLDKRGLDALSMLRESCQDSLEVFPWNGIRLGTSIRGCLVNA